MASDAERIEQLEAALAKAWEHMEGPDGDLSRCGVCGVSEYGLWLTPELHAADCVIPTIRAALPLDKYRRPRR